MRLPLRCSPSARSADTGEATGAPPTTTPSKSPRGAEDYYSGKGEAPGTWTGQGAANLGLTGELQEGELQALFERRDPRSGDQLGRPPGEHAVKGIDLQMAVPKSVSTLWALADEYGQPEVAGKVWEATHGAGRAALDYLERRACTSRAGKGGHIPLKGRGSSARRFRTASHGRATRTSMSTSSSRT